MSRKVEPLKELSKICQKENYRNMGNWMARRIIRDMALPITWLLLHFKISANTVTTFSIMIFIIACYFFIQALPCCYLAGSIFMQFWYLLDHVDGQIARYKKQASITGLFYDFFTHYIIYILIFTSLGFGLYLRKDNFWFLFSGFFSSQFVLLLNLINDCKYKAFFAQMIKSSMVLKPVKESAGFDKELKGIRFLFSWMHKICEIHVIMNILTISAILSLLMKSIDIFVYLLFFYFYLSFVILTSKVIYLVSTKKIDKEYKELFGS